MVETKERSRREMRKRRQFTNEFKEEAVKLAERGDIPISRVAQDLDVCESVLRRWMERFGTRANGTRVSPDEHDELFRLRRENRVLAEERDILKKAVSIFSKELR
jgi:transposase